MDKNFAAEKGELNVLLEKGVSFDIDTVIYKRLPGIKGLYKKRVKITGNEKYTIQEPTLSTLDRISSEQLELAIDESVISKENALNEAKRLTSKHTKTMCRILALSVMGEDYLKPYQHGAVTRYKKDDKQLKELEELFMRSIKPSKLLQLTLLVNTISNLGDFMNSIRLMSAARTTMPDRIEVNKEA